jgi:type I restriction-modification system DNA methylase subunit
MALSWNEIKTRAIQFSKEWENETNEHAEAKTFWNEFFNVFGVNRRKVATFELYVQKLEHKQGFIDLFWPGMLLVEHKSKGKDLNKAFQQAIDYCPGLNQNELPKYILVSDFERIRLHDLEENKDHEFTLKEFYKNIKLFGFILGYRKKEYKEEDPVNIEAAQKMGRLHDKLKEVGYTGHDLEMYLVRLLFCLFAEDTTIFERDAFKIYIENKTNIDGSDLAMHLAQIFHVLNKPIENRLKNIDDDLNQFPYVNGKLFEENLPPASFDSQMRQILLDCCALDWGKISPAIFGSLFQSVMNAAERRNLGAHYTSEKNIFKLIKSLFLDELWKEFEKAKSDKKSLIKFHEKIAQLRLLDPACGCGNFLVIAYRELRLLEMEIIRQYHKGEQQILAHELDVFCKINVDRFYGIEIEEFPAQIAQVALWLMDHQMNMKLSEEIGEYYVRLPLRKSPTIIHGNSLQTDWHSLINPIPFEKREQRFDYILGNPPFIGKSLQNESQKADIDKIFAGVKGSGVLDYVTCWYIKAAQYLQQYSPAEQQTDSRIQDKTKVAFVSTNSISQGEQVGILWNELFNTYKIKIHFAHRTFSWTNEARGKAAVHVVIIGFANFNVSEKYLYEYESVKAEPHERKIKNINPYLVEASDLVILKRRNPICNVPEISFGSMPNDGGHFLLTDEEKKEFLKKEPGAKQFIKPLLSAREFLNGENRWCLWLINIQPSELKQLPEISKRVQLVKEVRSNSDRAATKKLAAFPTLFGENRQPNSDYILIPLHSSENRKYIPLGFFSKNNIANNSTSVIPNAFLFHFGVIMSEMHITWVKYTCGRIKSDFRYSNEMVYNNYPWPENPTDKQTKAIEDAAQKVLDTRTEFPNSSLADLYDPLTMPSALVKAHQNLDKAVDLCYRSQPFINETKRIEFLFELYEKYTAGMFGKEKTKKDSLRS